MPYLFYPIFTFALTLLVYTKPVGAHNGAVAVAIPLDKITIDGDLSDWPADMTRYPIGYREWGDPLKGDDDFAGSFRLGYSQAENALYIAVEIKDDEVVPHFQTGPQTQDGCYIFLDQRHPEKVVQPVRYQLWGEELGVAGPGSLDDVAVQVVWGKGAYRYEWWVRLQPGGAQPGRVMGMDVMLIDNDAEESASWLAWGKGGDKFTYADVLGDLLFVDPKAAATTLAGQLLWRDISRPVRRTSIVVQSLDEKDLRLKLETDHNGHFAQKLPAGSYSLAAVRQETTLVLAATNPPHVPWQVAPPSGRRAPLTQGKSTRAGPGRARAAGLGARRGSWLTFGIKDGLPPATVDAILQDSKGQLWFGTGRTTAELEQGDGVVRYDGAQFVLFSAEDGLAGNTVLALAEDQQGQMWFAAWGVGISRYNGSQFTTFTSADGLASNEVKALAVDGKGDLWLATDVGLSRYDGRRFTTFTTADGLPHNRVNNLAVDHKGQVWIATDIGVSLYAEERFTNYTSDDWLRHNYVPHLAVDDRGPVWFIDGSEGLSFYDGEQFASILPAGNKLPLVVMGTTVDSAGQLWLSSFGSGIWRYNGTQLDQFTSRDGLEIDLVMGILADEQDNIWCGNLSGGISRYDSYFLTLTTAEGLAHNGTFNIQEDKKGGIWIQTREGLNHYDGRQIVPSAEFDRLCLVDRHGKLWLVSTDKGLGYLSGEDFTPFAPTDTSGHHLVSGYLGGLHMLEDQKGRTWFGTQGNGVGVYDGSQWEVFTTADGLASNFVRATAEDRAGHLWFAHAYGNAGVSRYDGKHFTVFDTTDGLQSNNTRALVGDRHGHIWVGTWGGGLSRYDGDSWKNFAIKDGLSHDRVEALLEDQQGKLWIGTWGGGINVYDGVVFQHILKADGLPHNAVQDLTESAQGDIWVATEAGAARYRPSQVAPKVRLTNLIADRVYGPVDRIRIPSTQSYVLFEFQGTSLSTRPNGFVYLHRVRGVDKGWHQTRDRRIEYAELPLGTHTFELKAVDRDLNYSAPVAVEVEVYYQSLNNPVRLVDTQLNEVFASFYAEHTQQPLGQVTIANDDVQPHEVTLRFAVAGLTEEPFVETLTLEPRSQQQVALRPQLSQDIIALEKGRTIPVDIELSYESGGRILSDRLKTPPKLVVHPRGALRWDSVGRAAAFITPADPQVTAFARQSLVAFEQQIHANGNPLANLTRAMVLFAALKAHSIHYLADANSPYAKTSTDRGAIDHIQYPAQLLQSKSGDCDDLTVLFASLLENAGVPTALVDYPGHIFLLFDSGISRRQSYKLPLDEHQYIMRADRLWIPVELTSIGQPFAKAWQQGLEQLQRNAKNEHQGQIVDTVESWNQYPPTNPAFSTATQPPASTAYKIALLDQHTTLSQAVDQYLEDRYLDVLEQQPNNHQLRAELGQVYVALKRYDKAIKTAYNHLRSPGGETASTYNHLGILHYFTDELEQAAFLLQKSIELAPQDTGIKRNLQRIRTALGELDSENSLPTMAASSTEAKSRTTLLDEDSFYWGGP